MQRPVLTRARTSSMASERPPSTRQSSAAATDTPAVEPKTVHEFNHDIHLLDEWVEQVLNNPKQPYAGADVGALVRFLQQYNVCFEELVRHTTALSPALARVMQKVWAGAFAISESVLKARSDRLHIAQKLQADAQDLLNRGASESLAAKVQQDEYALQAAAHRAQARVLEAELEALREQYTAVEKDNQQLRSIVYKHIFAMEYDPANEQNPGRVRAVSQGKVGEEALEPHALALLRQRGVALRQTLNEQEEELQLLLQEASNEADRQAHLLVRLEGMMLRHQSAAASSAAAKPATKQHTTPNAVAKPGRPLTRMTQVDVRKDLVGRVMRTVLQLDKSVQTDVNMHLFRLGVELSTRVGEPVDDDDFGDDPPPLPNLEQQDETIPYAIRRAMTSFPEPLRIPSKRETRNLIMIVYLSKIRDDARRVTTVLDEKELAEYLYGYLVEHYTLTHMADVQTVQIMRALHLHAKEDSRISMFAAQLGLTLPDHQWTGLDERDTAFLLDLFRQLEKQQALDDSDSDASDSHDTVTRTGAMRAAMSLLQSYLMDRGEMIVKKVQSLPALDHRPGRILLDPYIDIVMEQWQTIRTYWNRHFSYLFRRRCGFFRVVHEVRFANDRGRSARDCITTRVEKEVARECSRRSLRDYHAKEEPIMEKPPSLRTIPENPDDDDDGDLEERRDQTKPDVQQRHEVAELIDQEGFYKALTDLRCSLPMDERENIFQEGLRLATKTVYRELSQVWSRHVDHETKQSFFYNHIQEQSQWAEPYDEHTFQSDEIDEATFITIATRYQLLAHSPLVCLVHLPPEKLWADADVYLRQMHEGTIARADSF